VRCLALTKAVGRDQKPGQVAHEKSQGSEEQGKGGQLRHQSKNGDQEEQEPKEHRGVNLRVLAAGPVEGVRSFLYHKAHGDANKVNEVIVERTFDSNVNL